MTQRLSAPLMQVLALQYSTEVTLCHRSLYVVSSGNNFKACRSRHTLHSYEDGRTATLHSQQVNCNKKFKQMNQSLLVLPAADLQLAQVTEGQQTICLFSISASCIMQSVYHAAVLPKRQHAQLHKGAACCNAKSGGTYLVRPPPDSQDLQLLACKRNECHSRISHPIAAR